MNDQHPQVPVLKYHTGQIVWYACRWRMIVACFPYTEYWKATQDRGRCTATLDARYNLYELALCTRPADIKLGFESWIESQQKKRPHTSKKKRALSRGHEAPPTVRIDPRQ